MFRRGRKYVIIAPAFVAAALASYWLWDHRGYWIINNFREVEPGRIYAGAFPYPKPLKEIIRRHKIKTVLSLREGDKGEMGERTTLRTHRVRFHKIIVPYQVPDAVRIAAIEEAIAFITDERNQPVYVHCWAGCHRTGAVVAIYRVSRCNWTESEAREELESWGGTARGTKWPMRVLRSYCSHADSIASSEAVSGSLRE
jgi:hypothetical protein